MSKLVGQVTKISGEYVAKSADGTVKILAVGSLVYEDDLILGRKGIELEISLQNGDVLELQGNGVARLTPAVHSDLVFEKEDVSLEDQSFFAGIDEGQFYLEDFTESSTATLNVEEYLQGSITERTGLETDIWASIDPHKASIAPEQLPGDPFESTIVPNTPPQILIDPFVTTDEDTILTISMRVIDKDGTAVTTASAQHGSVVVNNDGTITYTPEANYNGADTITITATDDDGTSVIQTSSITINDVNDAPTLTVETTKTVDEDGTTTITYSTADIDGTTITTASAQHGSVVVNNDGTITYTPEANYNGADTITITATDDDGASVIQTSSITINDVNDAPTLNSSASISFNEDMLVTGAISASDIDGDTLSFSLQNGFTAPTGFVLNNNGTYSFDASSYDGLKAGDTQDFSIPITISDGVGGNVDSVMNVTIHGVDNDMTYTSSVAGYKNVFGYYEVDHNGLPIGTATIAIDDQHTISGGTHIADLDPSKDYGFFIIADGGNNIDANSVVTFNTSGAQPVLLVNGNTIAKSVFHDNPNFNSDGKDHFIIVPDPVNGGVSIRVEDQSGLGNVNFMDMVIHSDIAINDRVGNDAQANNDSATTAEKTSVSISVLNNDVDGSGDTKTITQINGQNVSNGDSITIINGGAVYGTATLSGNQILFTPDVSLHQLSTNQTQNVLFSYTISDGHASVNTATVTVTVTGTNDLPVVTVASTATVNEDSTVTINYSATDIEGAVTTTASSPNGTVTINNDGTLTFTPTANFNGNTSITLSATDTNGAVTSKTVAVSVIALNDGPDAVHDDLTTSTGSAPDGSYTATTTTVTNTSGANLIYTDTAGQNTTIHVGNNIDKTINMGDGDDKVTANVLNSSGTLDMGSGNDVVNLSSNIDGTLKLGDGNDYVSANYINGGTVNGGAGYDVLRLSDQNSYNNRNTILSKLTDVEKVELAHTDGSYKTVYKHTDGSWNETSNTSEYLTSSAQEDAAFTITPSQLLSNDTDIDGDTLTIASVQDATNGSVALVNGNVVFTPTANYNGLASFTYTISDGHGGTDTATVTLNIDSVNDTITQVIDTDTSANIVSENLPAGTYTGVTLLASDADGQAITYSVPNNVPFSVAADGKVYTTQALDYETTSSYTFTATATSADGTTSTMPVTINVADVIENYAPDALNDSITVTEDISYTLTLADFGYSDSDGDPINSVNIESLPSHGTLQLDGVDVTTGTVILSVDITQGKLIFVPEANSDTDVSFTYRVSDGEAWSSSGTTTIDMQGVVDVPTLNVEIGSQTTQSVSIVDTVAMNTLGITQGNDGNYYQTHYDLTAVLYKDETVTIGIADSVRYDEAPDNGTVEVYVNGSWQSAVVTQSYDADVQVRFTPDSNALAQTNDVRIGTFGNNIGTNSFSEIVDLSDWGTVAGDGKSITYTDGNLHVTTSVIQSGAEQTLKVYNQSGTANGAGIGDSDNSGLSSGETMKIIISGAEVNQVVFQLDGLGSLFDASSASPTQVVITAKDINGNEIDVQGGYRESGNFADIYEFTTNVPVASFELTTSGGSGNYVVQNMTLSKTIVDTIKFTAIAADGTEGLSITSPINIQNGMGVSDITSLLPVSSIPITKTIQVVDTDRMAAKNAILVDGEWVVENGVDQVSPPLTTTTTYDYAMTLKATLTDTDGSESLSPVTLTGLPSSVTSVSDGTITYTVNGGSVSIPVTSGVDTTIFLSSSTQITGTVLSGISASVTSTESSNGATASVSVLAHTPDTTASAPTLTLDISVATTSIASPSNLTLDNSGTVVNGTAWQHDEIITGSSSADTINVYDGDRKTVNAGDGNDLILMSTGHDVKINAGDGSDDIQMGTGDRAIVHGDGGDDYIKTGYGQGEQIYGDAGNDYIEVVNSGNTYTQYTIDGGTGNDTIIFDIMSIQQDHKIIGGDGTDTLILNANYADGYRMVAVGDGTYNLTSTSGNQYSTWDNGNVRMNLNGVETIQFNDKSFTLSNGSWIEGSGAVPTTTTTYDYSMTLKATLTDTDGSESLSPVTLTGLPSGVTSVSVGATVYAVNGGSVSIPVISGVNTTILFSSSTQLTGTALNGISASVTSTESSNGATATVTTSLTTPIILDMNGDGIHTTSFADGVQFDINADGKLDNVGWVDRNDGLLVHDLDNDGQVDNGSELFGSSTTLSDGSKASDGYEALRDLDANKDNVIDDQDSAYNELKLWIDGNQDGKVDDGEMMSLKDAGVESMSLKAESTLQMDEGNIIGLESSYTTSSGEAHTMGDVWLKTSESTDTNSDSEEIRFDGLATMIAESSSADESLSETSEIALSSIFTLDEDPSLSLFAEDMTAQAGVNVQTNPTATKTVQEEVELYIDNSAENTMLTTDADPQANTGL